ncbi:MAG: cation-transporting P-type ATPase [Candidatus Altiarchaeia archaeon]
MEKGAKEKNEPDAISEKLSLNPRGLTAQEALTGLNENGYNEIIEKKQSFVLKFLGFFWGPIPLMIEVAAIISALISYWADFFIITFLLILNAGIGF